MITNPETVRFTLARPEFVELYCMSVIGTLSECLYFGSVLMGYFKIPKVKTMFCFSEYVQECKMLYVVMEKGDTDLSHLIRDISKTKKISMSMIIYYWTEMLQAVKDIHDQGGFLQLSVNLNKIHSP
jgi:serine/threonine protein kinase